MKKAVWPGIQSYFSDMYGVCKCCIKRWLLVSDFPGPGSGRVHKHKDNDRGCSEKKVDFDSTVIYELGECEAGGLERAHGTFLMFFSVSGWYIGSILLYGLARDSQTNLLCQISRHRSVKTVKCNVHTALIIIIRTL